MHDCGCVCCMCDDTYVNGCYAVVCVIVAVVLCRCVSLFNVLACRLLAVFPAYFRLVLSMLGIRLID